MPKKKRKKARSAVTINPAGFELGQLKIYAYIVPLALFMLLPIVYIFNNAFKPLSELFAFPPRFFVSRPTLDNFASLAKTTRQMVTGLSRYIFNSALVTLAVVVFTIIISSMAGYAFSKLKFKGKNALFEVNTLALMFVPVAVMIPRYLVIDRLGISDTYFAHILPLLAMPVGMFLLKQFIDQVPDELIEAAKVDGAGPFRIYAKVVIPLVLPALATVAILAFQGVWGNIETSSLFTTKDSMRTLTFFMNTLVSANASVAGQGMAAAGMLVMFVPNIILFIILQSKVMNTMAYSGMK
ncbi:MAG: carbohydrate ABC transporter permease [Clostridiales bacterium]|jgi:ABC-type glycerol-3-phosphate transport system permease component|nr:carbohydrate ABC transporter permease [Clostridiales bacterium]